MTGRNFRVALLAAGLFALSGPASAACVLDKVAEIPVTMEGLAPVMTAKINGVDAHLLVDYGAFFSSISRSRVDKFHVKPGPLPPNFTVLGVNGEADVGLTTTSEFSILGAEFHHTQFLVGGSEFGPRADGILGRNFLMVTDAELDLADGAVRLFSPKGCSGAPLAYWVTPGGSYSMIELEPPRGRTDRIVGSAKVNGQTIRVMFDSGASTSVLTLRAAGRAGIHSDGPNVVPAGLTGGFGRRSIETWIAPVESFKVGDEEIKNTRLRVGAVELEDVDMLLGADFMLSHRIYVARSQNRLYFTYNGGPVFRLEPAATGRPSVQPAGAAPPADTHAAGEQPKDASGFARRGAASAARRDYAEAISDLTRAMELEPNDPQHAYDRALARLGNRQPLLAMSDLDQALKLKPEFTLALLQRGRLKISERDEAGAGADFDAAVKIDPSFRLLVAQSYEAADIPESAIASYNQWIDANPKDERLAFALNGRCWARAELNRELDQALSDCNRALRLRPGTADILDSRGLVNLRLGHYDLAIADYDAALKLRPKTAWSLFGRGLAELKLGNTAKGQADLKAAAEIAPQLAARAKRRYGLDPDASAKP